METASVVRLDIAQDYASLFGAKALNGRTVHVEGLIAALTRATRASFRDVLQARHAFQAQVARQERRYDFLPASLTIGDPDGGSATVGDIRQGMLDGFFGRATPLAWQVAPAPPDVEVPGLEGTGPAIDLGMAMGALHSGASSWMWDWEDAGGDYRDQLYAAWRNLKEILAHQWDGRVFHHPTKLETDAQGKPIDGRPRAYAINVPPADWPTIFVRVPGLHLLNRQIAVDGRDVPAMIPALVIHAVNNYESQRKNGSGIYFYVPKLESWEEARLVGTLLKSLESALGLPRGTLKIKVLNERAEFALQQDAIQWVLRHNLVGTNVGRWDYLNSREEMFRHDPAMVIPNPNSVRMTEPSLTHYTRRNALLATLAGGRPIGGMAAQMPNPRAPGNDAKALRDIWFDKLRERLTGLFVLRGTLRDTYRQSWVATTSRAYVAAGTEPLVADMAGLQALVDKTTDDERGRLEALGLLEKGRIAPLVLADGDLAPERLFSTAERTRLLARPDGPTTEDGLRYAMFMATEFMYQQLHGNNAAAIDDPDTGLRFMNDLATYEIFWHFLYLAVLHGVTLTAGGRYSAAGDRVTPALFMRLLDERRETVKQLFASRKIAYEATDAELVLDVLRRQIVQTAPDGALVPQPRWIKYGSRVLISLIEQTREAQAAIMDAMFVDRSALLARVARDGADLSRLALRAHDYVYDSFDAHS